MVWIENLSKTEKEERRRIRGLVEIAEEFLPRNAIIFSEKDKFYIKFEGEIVGEIKRKNGIIDETFIVSSSEVLKYAVKIAEEYEDYLGERVIIEKMYENGN